MNNYHYGQRLAPNERRDPVPFFSKPHIVGYMSVDVSRQYHHDLSQLKYVTFIPKDQISMDLNHKIDEASKRTTDDKDEEISLLLKFLLDYKYKSLPANEDYLIITYRRTLISIICNAYSNLEQLCIHATLHKNCIYLCSKETLQDKERRMSRSPQEKKFCAWGYKFEQFMTADHPKSMPDVNRPVLENEEFSIYYESTFGTHKLLYGAQIDGMLATGAVANPPQTIDVEDNLNFLRSHDFIELKTNREIQNTRQDQNFKRYKLLRCWCQCYLAALRGLLVGFRTDQGIVNRLQWFDTQDIVRYCKNEWEPQRGLAFLNYFLSFLKSSFKKINPCDDKTITLKFNIKGTKISFDIINDSILPDWYVSKC